MHLTKSGWKICPRLQFIYFSVGLQNPQISFNMQFFTSFSIRIYFAFLVNVDFNCSMCFESFRPHRFLPSFPLCKRLCMSFTCQARCWRKSGSFLKPFQFTFFSHHQFSHRVVEVNPVENLLEFVSSCLRFCKTLGKIFKKILPRPPRIWNIRENLAKSLERKCGWKQTKTTATCGLISVP